MEFNNNFNRFEYVKQQAAKTNRNIGANNKPMNSTPNAPKAPNTINRVNIMRELDKSRFNRTPGK